MARKWAAAAVADTDWSPVTDRLEAVIRSEADARGVVAEARREEDAWLRRVLSDQSDAVDDTNEVFGRVLAELGADVRRLRAEVAALRRQLAGTTPQAEAGEPAPPEASDSRPGPSA